MGLFDLLGRTSRQRKEQEAQQRARREDLDIYPGMRVEVSTEDGKLFLAAELIEVRGDRVRLKPCIEGSLLTQTEAPVPVIIRGRSSKHDRAVVMEALVRSGPNGTWRAEHLELVKRTDNRVSFRMDVDLEGTIAAAGGPEEPCRLHNISTGGACISMRTRYNVGEKLLLRVQLPPETEPAALVCQIVRINERRYDYFEYGCRFLDLELADENCILRSIFTMQSRRG